MEDMNSKYVNAKEASDILGVCPKSLYNYVRAGKLRKYASGAPARIWFDRDQLERIRRIAPAN